MVLLLADLTAVGAIPGLRVYRVCYSPSPTAGNIFLRRLLINIVFRTRVKGVAKLSTPQQKCIG